ncbi:MAG: 2-amino-4-hydroxy-6-hydroxymethyldihydropteridine diphosphokinase [Ignavibacteria bacterium]|nr:2-amino-4-hydroxy-6-hydroxymethyldihydropteridine diphosphokinase [Ignavibacteria bacterium]
MAEVVFLGLGSNTGDRSGYLDSALSKLEAGRKVIIQKRSGVYETEPWGIRNQNRFLNMVVKAESLLDPEELYDYIKETESETGRKKRERWHEREIDIDILFCGNKVFSNEKITIPHREIQNRKFVLIPMNEIEPDFEHPVFHKSISELLKETKDISEVNIIK